MIEVQEQVAVPTLPEWITTDTPLRRITLDEYHRLFKVGLFAPEERLELIEGLLVLMSPVYLPHNACITRLTHLFVERLSGLIRVRIQMPISLAQQKSEPEPDVVVAKPTPDDYDDRNPSGDDIFLAIEVAESSLRNDRQVKIPLYARAGIQEYWIVNLQDRQIEIHRQPVISGRTADYQIKETYRSGATVAPLAFPECKLAVADILR